MATNVEYVGRFLQKMIEVGVLHPELAPTPDASYGISSLALAAE